MKDSISKVIAGCWQFANGHRKENIGRERALEILFALADSGVTTFDCADIYEGVEELLGAFKKSYARKRGQEAARKLRFNTKLVPDLDRLPSITRDYVSQIIDRSIQRLRVEMLDLVQLHWWDFDIPGYVEVCGILADFKRQGKMQRIGVTNFDVPHLQELLDARIPVVSNQVQYSVVDRRPENGMADFCKKSVIELLCYGTAAGGFLSEYWLNKPEPMGELASRSLVKYKLIIDDFGGWKIFQKLLRALKYIAEANRISSLTAIAQRFVLDAPGVSGIIIGGTGPAHAAVLEELFQKLTAYFPPIAWCNPSDWDYRKLLETHVFSAANKLEGDVYDMERIKDGKHARIMRYNLNAA